MAKKSEKKAEKGRDIPDRIIDAALRLAETRPWRDISLAEIAESAELPLSEVYPVFPSKTKILAAFSRRIDAAVLAGEEAGAREGSARDRLFDVIMRRFDALGPHKAAVRSIAGDLCCDPVLGVCGLCHFPRSMACMLEAADLSSDGLRGAVRIKALGVIYLATLRVWLGDESEDLARTMAALDRNLRRAEWCVERCSRVRKTAVREPPGAAQATP